jgi:predicted nucleotidyltransferase
LWDIRRVCNLLNQSNQRAWEMFNSGIVLFRRENTMVEMRQIAESSLSLQKLGFNYLSDCEIHYERHLKISPLNRKKYIYLVRGFLSILYLRKFQSVPPVNLFHLARAVAEEVDCMVEIEQLFVDKKAGKFINVKSDKIPQIETFYLSRDWKAQVLALPTKNADKRAFDRFMKKCVLERTE